MRARIGLAALTLAAAAVPCRAGAQFTRREASEVREGPGNYYALSCVLPRGSSVNALKSSGGWVSVKAPCPKAASGWISKNCLAEKASGPSVAGMKLQAHGAAASAAAVAAAVRGFALRFGRAEPAQVDVLEGAKFPAFTPEDYVAFKARLSVGALPAGLRGKYRALLGGYDPRSAEEGVGMGIAAAALAKQGLDPDPKLRAYVNMIAAALGEASGAYDYPFKVYVTRAPEVNAVSVPGGYILVSRGLLSACRDESELAAALGHEIAHVLARHGAKEVAASRGHIAAEEAMDELDKTAGGPKSAEEAGLEDFAEEARAAAAKPRLDKYEEEADQGAAMLLVRLGYDPRGLLRMIQRAGEAAAREKDSAPDVPFLRMNFKNRLDKAEAFLKQELPGAKGDAGQARFQERMR